MTGLPGNPRETPRRPGSAAWDQLTPQELQVAELAAQGATNWEIGQRLYVSRRTVSTHLHRIFPKLGSPRALSSPLPWQPGRQKTGNRKHRR